MKKTTHGKCVLSLLMALTLIATLAPASAAPAQSRSAYAGTTMKCQIVVCGEESGSETAYNVDVPIPQNATKEEEFALVRRAADAAAGISTPRFHVVGEDLLSTSGPWTIPGAGNNYWRVGGGRLQKAYGILYVQFENVQVTDGVSNKINIQVLNSAQSTSKFYASGNLNLTSAGTIVFIVSGDGGLSFRPGNTLDIGACTNGVGGRASFDDCYVSLSEHQ